MIQNTVNYWLKMITDYWLQSNNNVSASRNHSSSETTVKQRINAPNHSSGINTNFPSPLMSVNNAYTFDAHPWPKNTILIAGGLYD